MPRYRPGPSSAARTWLESERGSKTSIVPRMSTACEPPSTKNAALGSLRANMFLAAKRDVVIQTEPETKLNAAGLTSGSRAERSASIPIRPPPSTERAVRFNLISCLSLGLEHVLDFLHRGLQAVADHKVKPLADRRADRPPGRRIGDPERDPDARRPRGE